MLISDLWKSTTDAGWAKIFTPTLMFSLCVHMRDVIVFNVGCQGAMRSDVEGRFECRASR